MEAKKYGVQNQDAVNQDFKNIFLSVENKITGQARYFIGKIA